MKATFRPEAEISAERLTTILSEENADTMREQLCRLPSQACINVTRMKAGAFLPNNHEPTAKELSYTK